MILSKKRAIALDIDNVLADTMNNLCLKLSDYLGYTVTKVEIRNHRVVDSIRVDPRIIFKLQDEVWAEWHHIPPTEIGIAKIVESIRSSGLRVYIATARPARSVNDVKAWLRKQEIGYDELFALGPTSSKLEVPADVLVDDAPEYVFGFLEDGREGFLYDQPWNRYEMLHPVPRIKSLGELLPRLMR